MKKLPQFQYQMDSDANRANPDLYKNIARYPPDRYQPQYPGVASFQNGVPYNYMFSSSLNQFYYPTYPYFPSQYAGNNYPSAMPSSWRDYQSGMNAMNVNSTVPRNYSGPEISRVAVRDGKEKDNHIVINLESDEQNASEQIAPIRNSVVPPKIPHSDSVIQIEDDSGDKREEEVIKPVVLSKPEKEEKKTKKQQVISKLLLEDEKVKPNVDELRTKPIRKAKRNQNKDFLKPEKVLLKEKKSSQLAKIKEQKKNEELEKKKQEKAAKQLSSQTNTENSKKKIECLEKIPYRLPQKHNQKDDSKRQIAKYLESHGEIRHGKQFQSKIPEIKNLSYASYQKWIEKKRETILAREIGAVTL